MVMTEEAPAVVRMARAEIRAAAALMSDEQARHLVDLYYQIQHDRIAASNIVRAHGATEEPSTVARWVFDQMEQAERVIQRGLDDFTAQRVPGRWLKSIYGIGPVLAAGLLAHIDITKAPTVGHIWRFAGLDPTLKWDRHQKRPYNAKLKTLCWKVGDSFVKFSGRPDCVYGAVYRERKALEVERNEDGAFAEQAAATLESKKFRDNATRKVYESGKLPDGRIDLRARRYAVKLFLSHLQHVMYEAHFGEAPPKPYILTRPEHAHFTAPPGWPMA